MLSKIEINEIFSRFAENKPNPKIELSYYSAFTLLIAVILSAQATDKGVNKVTPSLFALADTPKKMLELGVERLKDVIKSIGLFNTKAKNIIALSKDLIEKFGGNVPNTLIQLQTLPGVGRKSANVILNCIYGLPTIAVDTHIFRISNRIGFCNTTTPEKTEFELNKIIPSKWKKRAHFWLVLHGRYICKARKPECGKCIINDICKYSAKVF